MYEDVSSATLIQRLQLRYDCFADHFARGKFRLAERDANAAFEIRDELYRRRVWFRPGIREDA